MSKTVKELMEGYFAGQRREEERWTGVGKSFCYTLILIVKLAQRIGLDKKELELMLDESGLEAEKLFELINDKGKDGAQ